MGFLKSIIRNAVDEGVSKGIREAVSSVTEKIVAPKLKLMRIRWHSLWIRRPMKWTQLVRLFLEERRADLPLWRSL